MDTKQPLQQTIGTPRRVSNITSIKKSLTVSIGSSLTKVVPATSPSIDFDDTQVTPHRPQKRSAAVSSATLKSEHPPAASLSRSINRSRSRISAQQVPPSDAPMGSLLFFFSFPLICSCSSRCLLSFCYFLVEKLNG